jgi:nicotinamide-nucleotide amidase
MTDLNRGQADLPANAHYLQNDWAPRRVCGSSMHVATATKQTARPGVHIAAGVPFEMKNLMTTDSAQTARNL